MKKFVFDFDRVDRMLLDNEETLNLLRNDDRQIRIFGSGIYAKGLKDYLSKKQITVNGYVVDDAYLPADRKDDVLSLSEAISKDDLILVFGVGGGFTDWFFNRIRSLKELIADCNNSLFIVINDYWLADEGFINHEILDKDFVNEHLDEFKYTFDLLEDDISKETMLEFLYASTGKNASELAKYATDTEHDYDLDLLFSGKNNGVVIDCGAFDGESIVQMSEYSGNRFEMIALECDDKNYAKCCETVSAYPNIKVKKVGVWDKKAKLVLVQSDSSSYLKELTASDDDSDAVEVSDLDSLIDEDNVAALVMDIEGSELKALHGAKRLISNGANLAVRIYHKKEDLITIPQFIHEINSEYKFYVRYNKKAGLCRTGDETTLYAVSR
jgi:FkbM family methyltransferase